MPKFDSKTWNDKVFQKYLNKVEPTKKNSLLNSIIVNKIVNKMARALNEQVGGNYIVEPIKGDLTGKVQNYDGQTDFTYDSRQSVQLSPQCYCHIDAPGESSGSCFNCL